MVIRNEKKLIQSGILLIKNFGDMWKVEISFIQFDHIFFIKSDRKRIAQIVSL